MATTPRPSKLTLLGQEKSAAELRTLSSDAMVWLRQKIQDLKNPSRIPKQLEKETDRTRTKTLVSPSRTTERFMIGGMYFYFYDPKWKRELPYYDTFPLVIPLAAKPGKNGEAGFIGINLHYLPIKLRIVLLDRLLQTAIMDKDGNVSRIRIDPERIRKIKYVEPCLKHYLIPKINSAIIAVHPNEWDIATYLPIAQFKKQNASTVWSDSKKTMKKRELKNQNNP